MRTWNERHRLTQNKINRRKNMVKTYGLQQGTDYTIQRQKIKESFGYVKDGNITHFVSLGFHQKTRNRNRYGKVKQLCIRDARIKNRLDMQLEDMERL